MARKTRVRAIKGLTIESAIIWPVDADEGDPHHRGVTLELRLSGDKYFSFCAAPKVIASATALLADNKGGTMTDELYRTFPAEDEQ